MKYLNLWRMMMVGIWNLSEYSGIGLGRFAPFVFENAFTSGGGRKK